MYLGDLAMENLAKYLNMDIYTRDDKQDYVHLLTPDFWWKDAKWQHAILESGTYYTEDLNIETLPYF